MDASDELNKQSLGAEYCRYNREEKGGGAGELQRGFSFGACVEGEATVPFQTYMQDCEGQHLLYPGRNNMQIAKCQVLCTTSALRGRRGLYIAYVKAVSTSPRYRS